MARGEPLPPGFRVANENEPPPLGAMPTGVTAQASGQPVKPPEDLTAHNPIATDENGFTLMRNTHECPIPNESTILQQQLQLATALSSAVTEECADLTAKGLSVRILTNGYCRDNLKNRVACTFESDEKLREYHQEILDLTSEMETLQKTMQDVHKRAKAAIDNRWQTAVKLYGLNPAKNFYAVDEKEGSIHQLHLDCDGCKGKTRIRKTRQSAGDYVKQLQAAKRAEAEKTASPVKAVVEAVGKPEVNTENAENTEQKNG